MAAPSTVVAQAQWTKAPADTLRVSTEYAQLRDDPLVGWGSNQSGKFEEVLFHFVTRGFARVTFYFEITPNMRDSSLDDHVAWNFQHVELFSRGRFKRGPRGDGQISFGVIPYEKVSATKGIGAEPPLDCLLFRQKFLEVRKAVSGFFCEAQPLADETIARFFTALKFDE